MAEYPDHKTNLDALRRIEGQIRGIIRMIEEKRYCIDILTQVNSADAALMRVHDKVLEKHLHGCVANALKEKSDLKRQKSVDEILDLVKRSRK
ncbi:MAG TPA: metal-sensitive transcriptional regulator [Candidatus Omnitrophota bacterium]|nr:metal-sensitive transcriptional regulator [Candidatus Omnitrophota bacterium]